ncbi:abhydrolase domain-containing protein 1/3 [Nematocida minor]|uniref:abhydrolase domain-containing protein 1/3 n=1 Tax=Nematocida minor TaxID=1912983 RepID=UPI002220131E|nr:abhydrolase domain-containing protein 1/3 [Nematocida minor]KAI5192645.1 abhydrolase domain-containing protein 1/3 [Nematocida minor]
MLRKALLGVEKSRKTIQKYKLNAYTFFSFTSTLTFFSVLMGIKWVILIYVMYYITACKKITSYYQPTPENIRIVSKLKGLEKVFYPHILWLLPQIQTVSYIVRTPLIHSHTQVEMEQDDGGSFVINVYEPETPAVHTVITLHGLGGSANSKNVRILASHLLKDGHRVIGLSARGGIQKLKTPVFYHIGWTKDLVSTIKYALKTYTGTVSGIGFSLGGHWLTKTFGELDLHFTKSEIERIKGGMGISIPFDFVKISKYMQRPIPKRIYNREFAKKIHRLVLRNREVFEENGYAVSEILKANTMHDLDLLLTSKVFNIPNLEEYYYKESCVRVISKINKPFLILNSKDDPIVPLHTIPIKECVQSTHVILALTERGGHMGFLGYSNHISYAEEAAVEFTRVISDKTE